MNRYGEAWPVKRFHTLVSSPRYTDHENFWKLEDAIRYVQAMIGKWNNMNYDYESEQYIYGHIVDRQTATKVWDSKEQETTNA